MSNAALQNLIERVSSDETFRASLLADPQVALREFGVTPAEMATLGANDEESLRRMSGDTDGYSLNFAGVNQPLTINTDFLYWWRNAKSYGIPCGTHITVNNVPC